MAADAAGPSTVRRADTRFLLLYALANAGGVAAYLPFLTLLLPVRMAAAAGEARVEWLAAAAFAGAVSASLANIGWGWASDVVGTRRTWVAAGLALTVLSYGGLAAAATPAGIVAAVVAYQAALNMMLGPLGAWAADRVPDARKGLLGGLLGAGPPVGALAGMAATQPALGGADARLAAVCAIVAALTLPLLLARDARATVEPTPNVSPTRPPMRRRDMSLLWLSRLLVQVAGNLLFAFLLYYFQSLPGRPVDEAGVARLGAAVMVAAALLALALGRASDRVGARRPFLVGAALGMGAGLGIMASAQGFGGAGQGWAVAGYALFGCGLTVFLSLHSAYAMQMLRSPRRRGRDLGLFNLANTLPALLAPLLTVALVPAYGFRGVLVVLALLAAAAAALVAAARAETA